MRLKNQQYFGRTDKYNGENFDRREPEFEFAIDTRWEAVYGSGCHQLGTVWKDVTATGVVSAMDSTYKYGWKCDYSMYGDLVVEVSAWLRWVLYKLVTYGTSWFGSQRRTKIVAADISVAGDCFIINDLKNIIDEQTPT